jgi:hypothetical protein
MDQTLGSSSEDILAEPRHGGRSLTTEEKRRLDLSSKIKGWGSDLDPSVRPGVPMDKAPDIGIETLYPDFPQQIPRHKVFKSTEHAKLTPVFGSACPPRGLSGVIRDVAYGFSEGRLTHWLLLVFADRVDMIEELCLDVLQLRGPNVIAEMGLKSELKYNQKSLIKKAAIVGVGLIAVGALVQASRRNRVARSLLT